MEGRRSNRGVVSDAGPIIHLASPRTKLLNYKWMFRNSQILRRNGGSNECQTILALTNASDPSVIRIRLEGLRGPDLALLIKRIWPKIAAQVKRGAMVTVTDSGIRIRHIPLFDV